MKSSDELKRIVNEKYSAIARQEADTKSCACACCCGDVGENEVFNIMSDDYGNIDGYKPEADLGLGCGLPTQYAGIRKGDTVLDLGSGAGNDCFVARKEAGPEGKIIGIDFSDDMIVRARQNAQTSGFDNVSFILGDIESIPLEDQSVDVIVSNCVLNLVPDKRKVFTEMHRVLRPGGHFSISDIVLSGELPASILDAAMLYAGCVSGAIQKEDYLDLIKSAGFREIEIQQEKPIILPDSFLEKYVSEQTIADLRSSGTGIYSVTVCGKP